MFWIIFSKEVKSILLLLETLPTIRMWQESSPCSTKIIFQQAIRIWRLFFKSAFLMQVVEQNETTVSIFTFWNANRWYSNSSVLKHMIKRPRRKFLHCCVCFYSFIKLYARGFMQEEIHFWDGTTGDIGCGKLFQVLTCHQYEMNRISKVSPIQFTLLMVFLKSFMNSKQSSYK